MLFPYFSLTCFWLISFFTSLIANNVCPLFNFIQFIIVIIKLSYHSSQFWIEIKIELIKFKLVFILFY